MTTVTGTEEEPAEATTTVMTATAAPMDDDGWDFLASSDVLVEILLRLPPSSRRRLRLVCRLWRYVVDNRTPEMRSRAALLFQTPDSAYVVDELSAGAAPVRRREVWARGTDERYKGKAMVGTCNGLLCLCDDSEPGGAITLANPATGETLALPPLPCSRQLWRYCPISRDAYGFAYHPTTGRYKVLHLPCYLGKAEEFGTVQVFTLGEPSWRDVPSPGASCRLDAGIVSVDGATYWLSKSTQKVMSFDLEDESITLKPLPAQAGPNCHLTELRGRLGIAISDGSPSLEKIEVWVLEGVRSRQQAWTRRYSIQVHTVQRERDQYYYYHRARQRLTRPHFVHGGHVLTTDRPSRNWVLYGNRVSGGGADDARRSRLQCGVVRISERKRGAVIGPIGSSGRMFAYVETTEPLSVYRLSDWRWIYRP